MSSPESTENPGFDTVLDFHIFEPHDDEEDLFYKNKLVALVEGEITPQQAATEIDTFITHDSERLYKLHRAYHFVPDTLPDEIRRRLPLPHGKDERELGIYCPNPGGHIEMFMHWVFRLGSAFPPGHVGQDRLIAFLKALRDLPRHKIVTVASPSDNKVVEENMYTTLEVWPMGGHWLLLQMVAHYEEQAYLYRLYAAKRLPPTEIDLRLRNFQSAIARMTALDLIDCGWLSSLEGILPSHPWYPDLNDPEGQGLGEDQGFRWLAGWIIAGAQWLLRAEVGRYVYQQCLKREKIVERSEMWSMERWRQWKDQFAFAANEARVGVHAQELARLALQKMTDYEGGGDAIAGGDL
ncbi:hypothetical protein BO86DRAFT_406282 [Aspergillus japonicus CBS 114.51]|uniref:Uncharacterized protein n=2 Tax=Aspergillus TaxID=5052 RepID=A0A2V5GX46_ASPV1|nr:hypothetical protein BO86DRAFT_406282 [Aspergillus japonicus CBS 114.51]PYI15955.1 hypothetical protein BO99DRAFT_405391 [Aspergillus violaceofuscus CBS 115571]RAH86609.1 hypothetical protein BO86DRAFT_406282 [Aspergillus japonicus CBS 114.51]